MEDDFLLLERWRSGDQHAGEELLERHFEALYRFFDNKCQGAVDDLVQQTMMQCVRARDQFRGASSFRTYLFAIARHELYEHLRSLRRDQRLDFDLSSIADIVTTVGTRLGRRQQAEQLKRALTTLSVEQQVLLEMHYWFELDSAQLSEILEIPTTTVRTKLFRARKALRDQLEHQELAIAHDRLAVSLSALDDEPAA